MAPVNWLRGPWQTQPNPYGSPLPSNVTTPSPSPYERLMVDPQSGGGRGPGPSGEPAGYGPYGSNVSNAMAVGLGVLGGPPGWARASIPAASLVARAFGAPEMANPYAGLLTPADIRDLRDYDPNAAFAAMEARTQRENEMRQYGMEDVGERNTFGPNPATYGEDPGRSANDLAGTSTDTTGSSASTAGTTGPGIGTGGMADPGGEYAKGGVAFALRPRTLRFGEPSTGGETAIMIPEMMKQPGLQGNEMQVRRGLAQAYRSLGPPRRMGT